MKRSRSILVPILAALVLSCSNVRTHYDFDPSADFTAWKSYGWYPNASLPVGDPRLDNPLLQRRIEEAIDRTLGEAGFAKALEGEPDFYVNYHLSTEEQLRVRTMNRTYMAGPHGRRWYGHGWSGVGVTETHVEQYEVGTLVIDFVDVSLRQLVWRGSGTRRLARNPQANQVTQRVNEAVSEVLRQFPPRT